MIPDFKIEYQPDFRQKIADAWPKSIDDSESQKDWGLEYNIGVNDLAKSIMDGIDEHYKENMKIYMWDPIDDWYKSVLLKSLIYIKAY